MAKKRQQKKPDPTRQAARMPRIGSGDESKEMLSEWWHDNGKYLIAGLVLAVLGIGGWKGWGYYTETRAMEAVVQYEEMLDYIALEDEQDAARILNILRDQYGSTTYATFASFAMAKFRIEQEKLKEAAMDLRWIAEYSRYEELRSLASVRMVRVLLELGEREEAYEIILSRSFPRGLEELLAEVQGDYLVKEGEYQRAEDAYRRAISNSVADDYNFIMMKVEEIGGQLELPE